MFELKKPINLSHEDILRLKENEISKTYNEDGTVNMFIPLGRLCPKLNIMLSRVVMLLHYDFSEN